MEKITLIDWFFSRIPEEKGMLLHVNNNLSNMNFIISELNTRRGMRVESLTKPKWGFMEGFIKSNDEKKKEDMELKKKDLFESINEIKKSKEKVKEDKKLLKKIKKGGLPKNEFLKIMSEVAESRKEYSENLKEYKEARIEYLGKWIKHLDNKIKEVKAS
jgi:hypothetical protein